MLNRLIETLYNQVFVNIVVEGAKTKLYVEVFSGSKNLVNNAHATFDTVSTNEQMLEFISSYTRDTPYFYICVFDNSLAQGAIPTCDKNEFSLYHDLSTSEYKCTDKEWTYFTSKSDLYAIEKKYHAVGVDFIFSPFSVLTHFFKDKIDSNIAMYVLVELASISIAVFQNSKLLFADHLDMHHLPEEERLSSESVDDDEELDLDEGIDLEDIDVDSQDMDLIDDFGDIEDLDTIEEIDEFSVHRDEEEAEVEELEDESSSVVSDGEFNEDYQRFNIIQSSISKFYEDERYESCFIQSIYIADNIGVSPELKRYLEEEMFLSVYVRQINISMEISELAREELKR